MTERCLHCMQKIAEGEIVAWLHVDSGSAYCWNAPIAEPAGA